MAAVLDRQFTGAPVSWGAVPSARFGWAAAALLSVGLHVAGVWPVRSDPASPPVTRAARPMVTRTIYIDSQKPAAAPPTQAERERPHVEPAPAPAPVAGADETVMATPRPAPSQRPASVAKVAPTRAPSETPTAPLAAPHAALGIPAPEISPPLVPAPPAPAALPPALAYASAATLNPPPRPLSDIDPDYPKAAGLRQGTVVLRLLIDETGHVDNVAVVRSSPKGLFEESALAAFGKAAFSPGMLLGVAVKSQWTVEVEFTPVNRGASVAGRDY